MTRPALRMFSRSAALVAASAASSAFAAPLDSTVVFQAGAFGYNSFRIPAITRAANGDLLAFAEGRKNSSSDTGNIDLVLRRSADGGQTWGALQVVGDDGSNTFGNPMPVLDANTGRLVLLTTHNIGTDSQTTIQNGTSAGTRTAWVQTSDDNGATWTAAREITSSVKDPTWRWYATGPGHAIQLTRGPNAGRLLAAVDENSPTQSGALSIYSDDGGQTWQRGATVVSSGTTNLGESVEVELTDGRVQLNSRNRGGTTRSRTIAYSSDSGVTFGAKSQAATLIDPTVQGSILRFSAIDQGGVKNRILFSNPADASSRVNMTVRSSFDETATWNAGKRIYAGPSAYSDLVAYGAGRAGVLYENGAISPYEKITFAAWNDGWLEDKTIVQLDFNEKTSGAASATTGAILDSRGYGLQGTAVGAPTYLVGNSRWGGGSALHFSTASDVVTIPDTGISPLDFTHEDSFTLDCVFRTTDHGSGGANSSGPLISKDVGSNQPSFWMRVEDGKARFLVSDTSNTSFVTSSVSVNDGDWHSLTAIRDTVNDQLRIYVDFVLVGTAADTTIASLANANPLVIGGFNNATAGTKQFVGDIDFIRVSSGVLEPSPFDTVVPEPASMLAIAGLAVSTVRRRRRVVR